MRYSDDERSIIEKFRLLDERGKSGVLAKINFEIKYAERNLIEKYRRLNLVDKENRPLD